MMHDFGNWFFYYLISFNLEQRDICMYRLKLLQYLDRLSTYEAILGGVHMAHEEYCHIFFERFREINIMQAAVEYARVCFSCCVCCSFKSKEFDFGISLWKQVPNWPS